jgi:phosphopantothenate-cysteine ligase/phosphopantothenoylcysteine decarboxylase/phosphopantothenate--cysteine ligase
MTGLRIAHTMAALGHVDLLTSNREHLAAMRDVPGVATSPFTDHAELRGALAALTSRHEYDAIFMTAAVADYKPVRTYEVVERSPQQDGTENWRVRDVQAGKVKSSYREIAILGERTEKLVDLFRSEWNHRGLLFKFKLEVGVTAEELIRIGQASRRSSGAEYLVANTLDMVEGPSAGAFVLSDEGDEWVPRDFLRSRLADIVGKRLKL